MVVDEHVQPAADNFIKAQDQTGDYHGQNFNGGVSGVVQGDGGDGGVTMFADNGSGGAQNAQATSSSVNGQTQNAGVALQSAHKPFSMTQSGSAPIRDWGFVKWQANPFPEPVRQAVQDFAPTLGTGLGTKYEPALGGAISGAIGGAELGGGVGAAIGAVAGGYAGKHAIDALDYVGIPSNVEFSLPNSVPADCNGTTCDRQD